MSAKSQTRTSPTTRLLSSNWSSARSYLCNGDAGDREQPTDNQFWGHTLAKEHHARNQGEHRKQQAEWCDAAHRATGDQPEPKAKPHNSSDENCVGECQPTTFIHRDKARQLSMFKGQRHQHDLRHREQRRPPHQHQRVKRAVAFRQDVGHRERESCPDHKQQRKRVCRQARPRLPTRPRRQMQATLRRT